MASRASIPSRHPTGSTGWWLRTLVTLQFVLWVILVPLHLASAPHWDPILHPHTHGGSTQSGHHSHHHDEDPHPPHQASDHDYVLAKSSAGPTLQPTVVMPRVGWDTAERVARAPLFPSPAAKPSGRAPPDPLGSRAPPVV
jgi:hypothetical protein